MCGGAGVTIDTKAASRARDVAEARALVDALRRNRTASSLARSGYGVPYAATHGLEVVVQDAERVIAALCDEVQRLREENAALRRTRIAAREVLAMEWVGPTPAVEDEVTR